MRDIEVKRATYFPGVPTMWIAIAALPDLDKRDFSSLRSCRLRRRAAAGGGRARFSSAKVGKKLKCGWGMTETCPPGTAHPRRRARQARLDRRCCCPASRWTWCRWRIPTKVMPTGEVGEIRIRGPNVTKGYWNKPKETAESFVGDRFLTGDIGYVDDGRLFLPGRPQEGHDHFRRLQRLSADDRAGDLHAPVRAGGDRDRHSRRLPRRGGEGLHHAAAPATKQFSIDELRAFLTGKLGKHELPAEVEFVAELPRTPVGKLSRHELRKQQPAAKKKIA